MVILCFCSWNKRWMQTYMTSFIQGKVWSHFAFYSKVEGIMRSRFSHRRFSSWIISIASSWKSAFKTKNSTKFWNFFFNKLIFYFLVYLFSIRYYYLCLIKKIKSVKIIDREISYAYLIRVSFQRIRRKIIRCNCNFFATSVLELDMQIELPYHDLGFYST